MDIIMDLTGLDFHLVWANRESVSISDIMVPFVSKKDLIKAKELSGRPQDLIDLDNLKKTEEYN